LVRARISAMSLFPGVAVRRWRPVHNTLVFVGNTLHLSSGQYLIF